MAHIFYPKDIYRVNNSSHPGARNFTKYIEKHVFNVKDDHACRICRVEKETVHLIISGCDDLSPTKNLERHDNVYKCIHVLLLLGHGFIKKYLGTNTSQHK